MIDYNSAALATRSHTGLSIIVQFLSPPSLDFTCAHTLGSLNMTRTFLLVLGFFTLLRGTLGIGQMTCVSLQSSVNSFSIVNNKKAAPILISANEWPGVQLAAADFAADILRVTGVETSITNVSLPLSSSFSLTSLPIIVGTLGKSPLIQQVINSTGLDVLPFKETGNHSCPVLSITLFLGSAVHMWSSELIREGLSFLFMTILNSLVSKLCSCHASLLISQLSSKAYLLGIGKLFHYICSDRFVRN